MCLLSPQSQLDIYIVHEVAVNGYNQPEAIIGDHLMIDLRQQRTSLWISIIAILASWSLAMCSFAGDINDQTKEKEMASQPMNWPDGRECAVSLTYDDSVATHFELVAPALESQGLRGTFYITVRSRGFMQNPEVWRELASKGHELGNHSLFHPCKRTEHNKSWLPECYDLSQYSEERFRDELRVANFTISLIDGKQQRSYGNNCCHTSIGSGDTEVIMDDILREDFVAGRGPLNNQIVDFTEPINLMQVGHFSADSKTFEQLKGEIEKAAAAGGWIVYMMHGVGEKSHSLYIDTEEHQKLIEWLGANNDKYWTAPLVDVAEYVKSQGKGY